MKHSSLGACGLLLFASVAQAQAQAAPRPSAVCDSKPKRIGEHYRLWLSFNPTPANDPLFPDKQGSNRNDDHSFECYGTLKINGVTFWSIPKQNSNASYAKMGARNLPEPLKVDPRRQGYKLNGDPKNSSARLREYNFYTSDSDKSQNLVRLALKLYDRDAPVLFDAEPGELKGLDTDDDLFGDHNIDLDFSRGKVGEGNYYWFWEGKDDHGNEVGSNLFLLVEHVETLYESNAPTVDPKLKIPKIRTKPFPGKGPSPSPSSRRSR